MAGRETLDPACVWPALVRGEEKKPELLQVGSSWAPSPSALHPPTHLAQRNGVHEEEVVVLPAEAGVQLLLYNEDNISRDNVRALGRESQAVTGLLLI